MSCLDNLDFAEKFSEKSKILRHFVAKSRLWKHEIGSVSLGKNGHRLGRKVNKGFFLYQHCTWISIIELCSSLIFMHSTCFVVKGLFSTLIFHVKNMNISWNYVQH